VRRRRWKNLEKSPSNAISVVTSVALKIMLHCLRDKKHLIECSLLQDVAALSGCKSRVIQVLELNVGCK
jgi:hypothetical protein